jgi:hypothetical protein
MADWSRAIVAISFVSLWWDRPKITALAPLAGGSPSEPAHQSPVEALRGPRMYQGCGRFGSVSVKRQENDSGDASKTDSGSRPHAAQPHGWRHRPPEAGSTGEQDGLRRQASQ